MPMFQAGLMTGIGNALVKRIKKPVYYSVYRTTGIRIQMAVHYYDLSMIGAVFDIPASAAKSVLPSKRLVPAEREPGISEIHVTALEYRSVDILFPYNEVAICLPVTYRADSGEEQHGLYYLHLPVTTEDARWGGVENLGLPKFVAEISFADNDGFRSSTLKADGKEIITLSVNGLPLKSQSWEFNNFGIKDGKLLRNSFQVNGEGGTSTDAGGAKFAFGDHPVAENLKALGIGVTAVEHIYVTKAQAVLSKALGSPLPL